MNEIFSGVLQEKIYSAISDNERVYKFMVRCGVCKHYPVTRCRRDTSDPNLFICQKHFPKNGGGKKKAEHTKT